MAYGTLKVDTIVYTSNGADTTTTISGIASGNFANVTSSGTISGATITGNTGQFTTITAVTGLFTTTLSGTNYVGFQAPATVASDVIWTLPDTSGTTGQFLSTDGSNVLSWASGLSASVANVFTAQQTFSSGITLSNSNVVAIKTATFNSQVALVGAAGAITIDWSAAQNQRQPEPTGTITYTFTAPPGPCHLQLLIDSDGTSTAQTINWPGSVTFLGTTWTGANNKKSVINFWYDGTNYLAVGTNQV